jgi:hypothetical protein
VRYIEEGARCAPLPLPGSNEDLCAVYRLPGGSGFRHRPPGRRDGGPADGDGESFKVLFLPGWELDYLWQILAVFRRAQAGEPGTTDLRELLHDLGYGLGRTVERITGDLQRVAVMLMLDIPAVRTLSAAALHPSVCRPTTPVLRLTRLPCARPWVGRDARTPRVVVGMTGVPLPWRGARRRQPHTGECAPDGRPVRLLVRTGFGVRRVRQRQALVVSRVSPASGYRGPG